jgi:PST family polysaccharide transporter
MCSFLIVVGTLAFPTWAFQGLEVMHHTTVCSVLGRLLATLGIFYCVKSPSDLVWATLLQASASLLSGLLASSILYRRLGFTLRIPVVTLRKEIRAAWSAAGALMVSEYLTNALSNAGIFVLGVIATSESVGIYAAVEKIARAANGMFWPFFQGLLPRAAASWQASAAESPPENVRRWALALSCAAILASILLAACAGPLLDFAFGQGWASHALLLRVFGIWLGLGVSASVFGQLWVLAAGRLTTYARLQMYASTAQVIAIVVLAPLLHAMGVALALVVAETVRLGLVLRDTRGIYARKPLCA